MSEELGGGLLAFTPALSVCDWPQNVDCTAPETTKASPSTDRGTTHPATNPPATTTPSTTPATTPVQTTPEATTREDTTQEDITLG